MGIFNLTDCQLPRWEQAVKATEGYEAACKTFGVDREKCIAAEIIRLDSIDRTACKQFLKRYNIDVMEKLDEKREIEGVKRALFNAIRDNFIAKTGWETMKAIFKTGVDVKIGDWVMTVSDVPEYMAQNEHEESWWVCLKGEILSKRKFG